MERLRSYSALFLIVSFGLFPLVAVAILEVAQQFVWEPWTIRQIQFGNRGVVQVTSIAAFSGGLFVAGYEMPNCTLFPTDSYGRPFCPVSVDYFLRQYDQSGRELWTRNSGHQVGFWSLFNQTGWRGPLGPGLPTISVGNDGVFTSAIVNGTSQISKYDLNGHYKWTVFYPGLNFHTSISAGRNGDLYVANAGQRNSSVQFSVTRYDAPGDQPPVKTWSHSVNTDPGEKTSVYAGPSAVYVDGIITNSSLPGQSIGLADAFLMTYSLDGRQIGLDEFGYPELVTQADAISGDGNAVYVTGTVYAVQSSQIVNPGFQGFIRKFSPTGNAVKMTLFHLPEISTFESFISADSSGEYIMAYYGGMSYLLKFNPDGSQAWSIILTDTRVQVAHSCIGEGCEPITAGPDSVYIGGSTLGNVVQSPDGSQSTRAQDGLILELSRSSSLVLFGVNPPASFALTTTLVIPGVAVLSYRRLKAKRRANSPNRLTSKTANM